MISSGLAWFYENRGYAQFQDLSFSLAKRLLQIHQWDEPVGFWYTLQAGAYGSQSFRGSHPQFVSQQILWTDENYLPNFYVSLKKILIDIYLNKNNEKNIALSFFFSLFLSLFLFFSFSLSLYFVSQQG